LDTRADISPDGEKIAFNSDRSGRGEIWVSDSKGENLTRVTNGTDPHWSPDGRRIAFKRIEEDGTRAVYIVRPNGTELRRITEGEFPSWSENGEWIYFRNYKKANSLWKIKAEGGEQPIQVTGTGWRWCAEYGGYVYFLKDEGFWRIPLNGGAEELVLADVGETSWGLGAKGIYYVDYSTEPPEFRRFDLEAQKEDLLETAVGAAPAYERLSVSPDGLWLVYPIEKTETDIFIAENFL
jgi:Tol biopolymer transport system component